MIKEVPEIFLNVFKPFREIVCLRDGVDTNRIPLKYDSFLKNKPLNLINLTFLFFKTFSIII